MGIKDKKDTVVLVGMPGCGKTTIGKILAKELRYNFYDMDSFIEEQWGRSVQDILKDGEDTFRDIESEACKLLLNKRRVIISTGGGAVKRKKNRDILKANSYVIYIDRPIESILSDVDVDSRPLLKGNKKRLYDLYRDRKDLYRDCSHIIIHNEGFIRDTIDKIKKSLKGIIKE